MSPSSGMLSQAELEGLVAAGEIDTVIVAFTDMQGRLVGKRVSARLFLEEVAAHGAECCNYLLAVDVDMNTVDGYAMSSWETGYGDMVMTPDFATLRLHPVAARHRAGDGRPVVDRRQPGRRRRRASILQPPARPARRARPGRRTSAPSSSSSCSTTPTARPGRSGYRGPDAGHRLQRRLRACSPRPGWSRCCATSASAWTARACTARASRASATSASRRSRSATTEALASPATTTRSTRTARRRSPTSTARALTFMAKFNEREGNSCHIHISLRGDDGERGVRRVDDELRDVADVPQLHRRPAGHAARADAVLRAEHQLLQALRRGQLRADRGRVGHRQPHLRAAGRRPRPRHAGREPRARRRRQPVPRGRRR